MTEFFFHDDKGQILMSGTCAESEIHLQRFPGGYLKTGIADCRENYYSEGEVLTFPEQPSEFHDWDWPTLAWIQDSVLAEKSVRSKRAAMLSATVDKINAVRWAAMSDTERTAWDTYRTALLNIPEQEGFPFSVIWPPAPQQNKEHQK